VTPQTSPPPLVCRWLPIETRRSCSTEPATSTGNSGGTTGGGSAGVKLVRASSRPRAQASLRSRSRTSSVWTSPAATPPVGATPEPKMHGWIQELVLEFDRSFLFRAAGVLLTPSLCGWPAKLSPRTWCTTRPPAIGRALDELMPTAGVLIRPCPSRFLETGIPPGSTAAIRSCPRRRVPESV